MLIGANLRAGLRYTEYKIASLCQTSSGVGISSGPRASIEHSIGYQIASIP